jgi:predicted ATP-grasp superfamily ATP-dependent carboligase
MPLRVLVAGTSTRAAADSAARAQFEVTAIDAFGDLDQHRAVRALSMPRDFGLSATARRMARASSRVEADAVAYLSPFENHPNAVAMLARDHRLLGNPPDVLRRVRDPLLLSQTLQRHGIPTAVVHTHNAAPAAVAGDRDPARDPARGGERDGSVHPGAREWMLKPLASGGGRRVRAWRGASALPGGCYLQERIDGIPGSVTFVAAGGRCAVLGVSRQLIGDAAFGATGYRYCGSMMSLDADDWWDGDVRVASGARVLADAISALFGMVGVNGVDFIVRDGVPVAIEVNPRWSASMELVDRVCAVPVMAAHVESCMSDAVPRVDRPSGNGVIGKAVVFATADVTVGDTRRWLARDEVRDVPWPGTSIGRGEPICTVFATAPTFVECRAALAASAAAIYAEVHPRRRGHDRMAPGSKSEA